MSVYKQRLGAAFLLAITLKFVNYLNNINILQFFSNKPRVEL
jgi:hypothetical protein